MKTVGLIMACEKNITSNIPKYFISLNNQMVLQYVINNMIESRIFDELYIITLKDYETYCQNFKNIKFIFIDSKNYIENGMEAVNQLPEDIDYIIIQDATRPFTPSYHFKELLNQLIIKDTYDYLITTQTIKDTLLEDKLTHVHPINRKEHELGQTPEIIKFKIIKKCILNPNYDYEKFSSFAELLSQNNFIGSGCNLDKLNFKICSSHDLFYTEQALKNCEPKINEVDLNNKNILLFGGSGDIGKAIKNYCVEKGANVVAPDKKEFLSYVKNIKNQKFDCVISSIGTSCTDYEDIIDNYDKIFEVNVWLNILIILACEDRLIKQDGNIIILGSDAGIHGKKNMSLYSASKASIHNFVESYSNILKQKNIRINVIAPVNVKGKLQAKVNPYNNQLKMMNPDDLAKIIGSYITTEETGKIIIGSELKDIYEC